MARPLAHHAMGRSVAWVRATQSSRQFLHSARSILEQVEALAARTQSTGRGEAGRLAVGFYTSLAVGNLRATLIDVSQRFAQLELEMFESSRARLVTAASLELLWNQRLDLASHEYLDRPTLQCVGAGTTATPSFRLIGYGGQMGGKHACRSRLGNYRSPCQSCRSSERLYCPKLEAVRGRDREGLESDLRSIARWRSSQPHSPLSGQDFVGRVDLISR